MHLKISLFWTVVGPNLEKFRIGRIGRVCPLLSVAGLRGVSVGTRASSPV